MSELDNILGMGDYQPPTGLEKAANAFRKFGHTLSMIPILNYLAALPVGIASLLNSTNGFFNKGFGAGTKELISGTVDTGVTFAASTTLSLLPVHQWVSGLATKDSIGELARKGTEGVLDTFIPDSFSGKKSPTELARETQVLGPNPMMTASYPAAVGYAQLPQQQMALQAPMNPMTGAPVEPNQWRQMEAQRRGQSLQQADAQWMSANHEDTAALRAAQQQTLQAGVS